MILITSGCSFSTCDDPNHVKTWPLQLEEKLNINHYGLGVRSQDNGMISRRVIHFVNDFLTFMNPENMLVGIMWSGIDRNSFYCDNIEDYKHNFVMCENIKQLRIAKNDPGAWLLTNAHWDSYYNQTHYKLFSNDKWNTIQTLEHILRTQWFLKQHKVNYFMMSMSSYLFETFETYKDDPNINYLLDMLDYSCFVETTGCQDWCINTGLNFRRDDDYHPTTPMHELYTKDVIIPYLKQNKLL